MHLNATSQASGFPSSFNLPPKQEVTTRYQLPTLLIFIDEIDLIIAPPFVWLKWNEMALILNLM